MTKKNNTAVPLSRRRRKSVNVKLIAVICSVLFVAAIGILFAVIGSNKKSAKHVTDNTTAEETTAEPVTEEETTTKTPAVEIDIMMIGDMLVHEGVVKSGKMDDGSYNYDHLYTNIAQDITAADVRIVNQETILGGSDFAYTGYPTFNSPQELGDAEVKAGFKAWLKGQYFHFDEEWKTLFEQYSNR